MTITTLKNNIRIYNIAIRALSPIIDWSRWWCYLPDIYTLVVNYCRASTYRTIRRKLQNELNTVNEITYLPRTYD